MSLKERRPLTHIMRCASIALLMLALLGILVRALIPAGFMPDVSGKSGTALVICSGIESKTVYLDENGQPASEHKAEAPCSFAPLTQAVHAYEPVSSLFVPYVADITYRPSLNAKASVADVRLLPARGPPSVSI